MKKNTSTFTLWVLLMASVAVNVYMIIENGRQREIAAIHLKLAKQRQEELSVFESKFEENLSVAKAAYARAEAQLEEAKRNRDQK
jgi:hypothetical protein